MPARGWRRALRWLVKAAFLALAVWLMVRLLSGLEWRDVRQRLAGAQPGWVVAAVVALVARFWVWEERWRLAVRASGPAPGRAVTFAALMAAATVNTLTPAARVLGGVLRARYVGRAVGLQGGRAYGSVLFDQLTHQVVIGAVTLLSAVVAAFVGGRARLGLWLAGATALLAVAAWWWLRRNSRGGGEPALVRRLAERVAGRAPAGGRLEALFAHGRSAVGVVAGLLADRRLRWRVVVLSVVFFTVNAGAQWLIFQALGSAVSFWIVLAVVALGAAAGILLGTPGGLGAAEAAMIGAFTALGVDRLDATAGSLLFRGLHFAVIFALGLPSLAWLEVRYGLRSIS